MVLSNVSGHIDNFWNNAGAYVLDGKHFPGMTPEKLQTEVDEILNALRQMRDFDTKPVTAPKQ